MFAATRAEIFEDCLRGRIKVATKLSNLSILFEVKEQSINQSSDIVIVVARTDHSLTRSCVYMSFRVVTRRSIIRE